MTTKGETIRISALIKGDEFSFEGTADEALSTFLKFISNVYPSYEIVSKIVLNTDDVKLLKDFSGIIAVAPEGPVLLKRDLSTDQGIGFCLIGARIGFRIGKLMKETLTSDELTKFVGKSSGTIANELTKMTKQGLVDRVGKGEYKITTAGTIHYSNESRQKEKQ
jgi:hypothetical protein